MRLIVVLIMVTCVREILYQALESNLSNYLVLMTYWYQTLVRDTLGLMWYLLCYLLRSTAQHLATSFQKDVDTAARPSLVIARYNALWLQFSRVVRQTGVAMCYTYGYYVLYLFLMSTVSLYGLLSTLTKGFHLRLVYLVGDSIITGTELYIICDGANSVTREVGLRFQGRLLDIRQTPLGNKTEKEVDAFLRTIELRPPEISFGDYVIVNRGMLLSLGSMMVTYLVVLLQLGIAGTSDQNDAANATTS
nr:gustatory receptor 5 [Odontotermes formosanus]